VEVFKFDLETSRVELLTEDYDHPCRVFLRGGKKYNGHLRIVSKETKTKSWDIEIDLKNEKKLRVLGIGKRL
jgi:hypothetical protein